ncbi:hypothetical protein ROZALSC1DRAFT_27838 [Rozella allomycis CSF55]|uniref:Uncharacterized protein n=1 Tax=Rozella allomycis (strain CSF55) TaxID=988480 RepID=A0A075AY82_ROZAC|nr:hypothetical protein O9G_001270 [Rozella allomycis CSF55]RKP20705.1 hypothetical protein ROZALSC1DRAFT_27838 [Rozella allomycis CSF55]|eukprot:EPZ33519.1 hypothetical protein O9G_001270 [Rozella allomycis CSF55]
MTEQERHDLMQEWKEKMRTDDWRNFTIEEKQEVYLLAFPLPPPARTVNKFTLLLGCVGGIAFSYILMNTIQSFGNGRHRLDTPEYRKLRHEWRDKNGINPIFGQEDHFIPPRFDPNLDE